MQPEFSVSFWPRLVRIIVISSIATIAYLRITVMQEHMNAENVNFDPCDRLLALSTRSALSSYRRNSRIKSQHGKQSKLRVSKRSLLGDKARRSTRPAGVAHEIQMVKQALADPSIQLIHITTFTTSFDFRSTTAAVSDTIQSPVLDHKISENAPGIESSLSARRIEPIFSLPHVRADF